MKKLIAVIAIFASTALSLAAFAEDTSPKDEGKSQPIQVTSDRLEADQTGRQVKFLGNVVARQGDVVIYANEMSLVYDADTREVAQVDAQGDVRIVQGERMATGQHGVLFNREKKIVLTGAPKLYQGEDFVSGDEITVFLKEERSIVSCGQGTRVNAVFHPKEGGK